MYLNCHSYHSLRYGTIPLDELVQQATLFGVTAMALTDVNTVTGIYDFIKACKEVNIKPLVGIEFRSGGKLLYVCLAKNRVGLGEMNRFLTSHNFSGEPLPFVAPEFKNVAVIYPLENVPAVLRMHEHIGIRVEQLTMLYQTEWKNRTKDMVVFHPVTFRNSKEHKLHKVLRAVDNNILLSKLTDDDFCRRTEIMRPLDQLLAKFVDQPQIILNTERLIDACNFEYDFTTPKNKKHYSGSKKSDKELLTSLAYSGLEKRYGLDHDKAKARVERELDVIDKLNFSAYFLITWDIVQESLRRGFMHVGRGSGANSIVSYCLCITDICPLELDLYFERFLNINRKSPPDFDIDWSWQHRDEILEYIFERFGRDRVAFTGTIAEFKYRSIFREVGKVFGLPKDELDALAKRPMEQHDDNSVVREVHEFGMMLRKYPNMRSMHSCGILISEDPLTDYTALEMPPKGFPIVQFDMHIAEDIGFEKFDILSQRGLGSIDDAISIIKQNRGITVDIRDTRISKNEATANEWLSIGKTIGCFYIESPAMRGLLRRLKCSDYITLVAASSVIRPGVAQSGMMAEYIFRHNNPDKFEYFHEVFKEHLGETYGVMVYQEDVIKIALHFGGLDAADGDVLRRAISGKGRSKDALLRVKQKFFACCEKQGHPLALSEEVYRQIESFAGYSFCKAHSASYAVESYQSLYLKVYYPLEFMVAVINNQGGFYRTEVYIHEARMSGAHINNPCVNRSNFLTSIEGRDIYLGFMHMQGLEGRMATLIAEERVRNGNYTSLENFIQRVPMGMESVQKLILIGAFRFTEKSKSQLLIIARLLMINFKPQNRQPSFLNEPVKEYKLPMIERAPLEDAYDELELLGFPVSCTPFDLLQTSYRAGARARTLANHYKETVRVLAYLISIKQVPTKRGDMYFGTWIDLDGEYFDTAHFPNSLKEYPFQDGGCYLLLGKVEVDYHFPTITIFKMAKMPFKPDPRYSHNKDLQFEVHKQVKQDVSMTQRAPYPQVHEIGLPRLKMKSS